MEPEFNLRRAVATDIAALIEFNQAMARETEGKELETEMLRAGIEGLLRSEQYGFYVVAEYAGASGRREVAGSLMITYEWSDWRNGLFLWIQSVYVKPKFRRQGIYRRLYRFVKELAATRADVCGFRLYVEKENRIAQQTYEQLGMRETRYLMYEETLNGQSLLAETRTQ